MKASAAASALLLAESQPSAAAHLPKSRLSSSSLPSGQQSASLVTYGAALGIAPAQTGAAPAASARDSQGPPQRKLQYTHERPNKLRRLSFSHLRPSSVAATASQAPRLETRGVQRHQLAPACCKEGAPAAAVPLPTPASLPPSQLVPQKPSTTEREVQPAQAQATCAPATSKPGQPRLMRRGKHRLQAAPFQQSARVHTTGSLKSAAPPNSRPAASPASIAGHPGSFKARSHAAFIKAGRFRLVRSSPRVQVQQGRLLVRAPSARRMPGALSWQRGGQPAAHASASPSHCGGTCAMPSVTSCMCTACFVWERDDGLHLHVLDCRQRMPSIRLGIIT